VEYITPGPAAYSPLSPSKMKQTAPAYSLGGRLANPNEVIISELQDPKDLPSGLRKLRGLRPTPGPGQCN
jgi:hypothetical protein